MPPPNWKPKLRPPSAVRLLRFLLLVVLSGCVTEARAQSFSGVATSPSITNYTGLLVDDGGALGTLAAEAGYNASNQSGSSSTRTCKVGFRLLDPAGNAVALVGATDATGKIVFSDAFLVALLAGGFESGSAAAALLPMASLVNGAAYKVEAQLYVRSPVSPFDFFPSGGASLSGGYRFTVLPNAAEPPGGGRRVTGWVNTLTVSRASAVATIAGGNAFRVDVRGAVGRLDHLADAVAAENFSVQLDATLTGTASGAVALVNPRTTLAATLANHTVTGGPASFSIAQTIDLLPAVQLDSTDTFTLTLAVSVINPESVTSPLHTNSLAARRLLHFNGTLRFGGVATRLNVLDNEPAPLGPAAGGGESTSLDLPAGGVTVVGAPGFVVAAIAGLPVALRVDGTADATGSAPAGGADGGTVNGVSFTRTNVTFGPGGATADVRVFFPAGFGVAKDRNIRRQLASFAIPGAPLDGALNPAGSFALAASDLGVTALYAAHEQLPVLFETTLIFWDAMAGTFNVRRDATHYVRKDELDTLDALLNPLLMPPLVDATAAQRPSNEGYFRRPDASPAVNVVVTADAQGRAVLTAARVDLPAGDFMPHFPPSLAVAWTLPGAVVVQGGALDLAQSTLPGAGAVRFTNSPNCSAAMPVAAAQTLDFSPAGNTWSFTADGGLRAAGTIGAAPLRWGARTPTTFAHVTGNFNDASTHLAGHVLRGAAGVASDDNQPGALLYSGHGRPGNAAYVERPGTAGYAAGFADYAGLNFRVASDGAQTATSLVADQALGPYPLRGTSKYYVRPGGVSGIHEAVTASFAALLGGFQPYGFPATLSGFQLAYLDNHNADSLIRGTITVPGVRGTPGFTQPFDRLTLKCSGQFDSITLPNPNDLIHTLHYWRAQFKALAGEFRHQPDDDNPARSALVFGAEVSLPGLMKDKLHGGLGFFSDGNLVTLLDGFTGVSSRLRRPAQMTLNGRRSALDPSRPGFTLNPVTDIYFNNARAAAAPSIGFVSVAGRVDVPFFEDMEVHIVAQATTGTSLIRGGWTEGGRNFFNDTQFDASNRGFSPGGYAAYVTNTVFDPHVKKKWLDFADFDLPVAWDPVRQQFASSDKTTERDFLVVKTQHILEQLTPTTADLRFGAQFGGLPRLNLAALVADSDEAANELLQHLPGGTGAAIASATKAIESLLNGRSDMLINTAVDAAVDEYLTQVFAGPLNGVPKAADAAAALASTTNALRTQLDGIVGTANDAGKVLGEIKAALDKLDAGLAAADVILRKTGNGPWQPEGTGARGAFITATVSIGGTTGQNAATSINNLVNGDLRDTLDEIHRKVVELHTAATNATGQLISIQALLRTALAGVNNGPADLTTQSLAAMQNYFATVSDPTGRYLYEVTEAKIRADLKQLVRDQVHASAFVADLQSALRDLLQPLRDEFNLTFERIHGVINDVLRSTFTSVVGDALAGALKAESDVNRAIGTFSSTLQLAKVEGTARIEGDTLVSAHLSAALGLQVPDKVGISGWIDYHNYKSGQPTPRCAGVVGADGRVEIAIGGEAGASIQGNPPVHAKLAGRYAMTEKGQPVAASGELLFVTDIKFDQMTLKQAHFKFAFGEHDNYLFAQGAGSFWFIDANVRAFLGQTCDSNMLVTIDPQISAVLKLFEFGPITHTNPITGLYWNGDGEGSLNRFFGIPDSKLLSIRGKGGQGYFAFFNQAFLNFGVPPTNALLILGVRARYGASVSLALATADAELTLFGAINPLPMVTAAAGGLADMQATFLRQGGGIPFVVVGLFTPTFEFGVGPLSYKKSITLKAAAKGAYTPIPQPGFIWVNDVSFKP